MAVLSPARRRFREKGWKDGESVGRGGTHTRKRALVSTIIRVSPSRMSFINASGKLWAYTCIYTSGWAEGEERARRGRGVGERRGRRSKRMGREREGRHSRSQSIRRSASSPGVGDARARASASASTLLLSSPPSLLAVSRSFPYSPLASYYYYFLSQYLLFPHSVLC